MDGADVLADGLPSDGRHSSAPSPADHGHRDDAARPSSRSAAAAPNGFTVVVPPEPELNPPAAAVLLRILTRHAHRQHSTKAAPDDGTMAGSLPPEELSVVDHSDHRPQGIEPHGNQK
jgi:hypothetical protein